jgi:hypothetical protein
MLSDGTMLPRQLMGQSTEVKDLEALGSGPRG